MTLPAHNPHNPQAYHNVYCPGIDICDGRCMAPNPPPYKTPKFEQDKLDRIFELQKELDNRIQTTVKFEWTENHISKLCTAIIHEAVELQRLTNWKWWKKPVEFDVEEARKELVDIIHFVVSAAIVLGMTPQSILEEYEKKNKINHKRQEQGY